MFDTQKRSHILAFNKFFWKESPYKKYGNKSLKLRLTTFELLDFIEIS